MLSVQKLLLLQQTYRQLISLLPSSSLLLGPLPSAAFSASAAALSGNNGTADSHHYKKDGGPPRNSPNFRTRGKTAMSSRPPKNRQENSFIRNKSNPTSKADPAENLDAGFKYRTLDCVDVGKETDQINEEKYDFDIDGDELFDTVTAQTPEKETTINYSNRNKREEDVSFSKQLQDHPYSNIYTWNSPTELAVQLLQSKVYEDEHIMVVCKPYGVARENIANVGKVYGQHPPVEYTLADALPILEQLSRNTLTVCIMPEKWNSGVLILSKRGRSKNAVTHSLKLGKKHNLCCRLYWAVTLNVPRPAKKKITDVGIRVEQGADSNVPVIVFNPSSRSIKTQNVKSFIAEHRTLAVDQDTKAALVQVSVSNLSKQSLRVWLTHHLAVVLGDNLLGGRVTTLLGRPVPVPYTRAPTRQTINYDFLSKLDLKPSQQSLLPLMLHCHSILLPEYHALLKPSKVILTGINDHLNECQPGPAFASGTEGRDTSKDLAVSVPRPHFFDWTLEKLGLMQSEDTIVRKL
uniref:RNA pseudouridylate synthase domain-containing protein 3-like n=1 Tax=Hirondellea gigas TaxID=1518452 RepID=A0A2P2I1I0_9CRUS